MTNRQKKPILNDVFILKNCDDNTSELERIGRLIEKRGKDGELLLMDLDPLPSQWEDLQGNSILYFRKKADGLYLWMDFETYADECEDWEQSDWPESAGDYIDLECDTQPPGHARGVLQRVLEDAERTIALIRQQKPIQKHRQTDGGWEVRNEVRPERRARTLGQILARSTRPPPRPDCDLSVERSILRKAVLSFQAKPRSRKFSLTLAPATNGIELSMERARRPSSKKLVGQREWTRRVVVAGSQLLLHASKESAPNLRITYMAGRLFLNQASIPAEEDKPNGTNSVGVG